MPLLRLALTLALVAPAAHAQEPPSKVPPKVPPKVAPASPPTAGAPTVIPAPNATTDTALTLGTYVSSRIDGKKLPMRDLATDDQGVQYLIEFAQLVLNIKANGEFRATLRYKQTLARKGERASDEPLQKMTVYGTWLGEATSLRFVPDPKRGGEGLRILAGTWTGRTITVPFDYQNGRVTRRANVLLVYDPKIF
jgi:hypothetical protein